MIPLYILRQEMARTPFWTDTERRALRALAPYLRTLNP
jgi:hypothetical protein